jgi:hypothetical protein
MAVFQLRVVIAMFLIAIASVFHSNGTITKNQGWLTDIRFKAS